MAATRGVSTGTRVGTLPLSAADADEPAVGVALPPLTLTLGSTREGLSVPPVSADSAALSSDVVEATVVTVPGR